MKILIADDDPIAIMLVSQVVHDLGHSCVTAANGDEAWARLSSDDDIRLAILDWMMPGLDGPAICQRLKNRTDHPLVYTILLTCRQGKEDMIAGLEAGAHDFIIKPPDLGGLRGRIEVGLRLVRVESELRESREQLRQANAELDRRVSERTSELAKANIRLAETLRLQDEMAHLIVHDMRAPLFVIMGNIEMTLGMLNGYDDSVLNNLEAVKEQSQRLARFADEILTVGQLEQGYLRVNRGPVRVGALLKAVAADYAPWAKAQAVRIRVEIPDGADPEVSLDRALIQRVLDNLVSNAIKFSPKGGEIVLSSEYPGADPSVRQVRIRVTDQGEGISAERRATMFNKFEAVRTQQAGVRKIGIGLYFCRLAVEAHGGHIAVSDNMLKGTMMTVDL